ncbi:putative AC9 transposase [Bienertia sinuspersici]
MYGLESNSRVCGEDTIFPGSFLLRELEQDSLSQAIPSGVFVSSFIVQPFLHIIPMRERVKQSINYDVAYYVNNAKLFWKDCEDYGANQNSFGSSKGKSRFGFSKPVLKRQRPDSSLSSSSSSLSNILVLARTVKDILAVPASTIASKSSFSVRKRFLDE